MQYNSRKIFPVVMIPPHEGYVESGVSRVHGYRVAGVRFSWGDDASRGSEHRLNGQSYPLEVCGIWTYKQHIDAVNIVSVQKQGMLTLAHT